VCWFARLNPDELPMTKLIAWGRFVRKERGCRFIRAIHISSHRSSYRGTIGFIGAGVSTCSLPSGVSMDDILNYSYFEPITDRTRGRVQCNSQQSRLPDSWPRWQCRSLAMPALRVVLATSGFWVCRDFDLVRVFCFSLLCCLAPSGGHQFKLHL